MNKDTYDQTLTKLKSLGLIDDKALNENIKPEAHTPWFITVFFGFTGILASVFFVGFLTLVLVEADIFEHISLQLMIGAILSATGWFLFKNEHTRRSTFWNSLAFTMSAAGQLYVAFSIFGSELKTPLDTWLWLLFQVLMTMVMPNMVYRLLSTIIALACAIYLFNYYQIPEISLGFLALIMTMANVQRYGVIQRLPATWHLSALNLSQALTSASAVLLVIVSLYIVKFEYSRDFVSYVFIYDYILAQSLLTFVSLYAAFLILKRYPVKLLSAVGLIIVFAIAAMGIMSIYISGLLVTSLIIVIAFANSQRILLGFSIFALVSYVFWYYYQLDTSLLIKSLSMLIIGIGLLLMRWLLIKRYFINDEAPTILADKERLL